MRRLFAIACLASLVLLARPAGGEPEGTTTTGGLRRGVAVTTLKATVERGAAERAVFAEVKTGGEVGFESE